MTPSESDFSGETVFYEGSPHSGDLAINLLLGVTILWLPLTIAAIGRKVFLKYRITDKRLSISTNAPWESNQTDIAYNQIKDVVAIGRGVGAWGDMVVTLNNGDRLEIRSLDKCSPSHSQLTMGYRWQEAKQYIQERIAALKQAPATEASSPSGFS